MWKKFARLFVIKTKFEAYLVIYAIALGAIERGRHYMDQMPGTLGWMFAVLCTGVVFVAGAKLIDSVKPAPASAPVQSVQPWKRTRRFNRNRPSPSRRSAAVSARARRTD